MVDETRPSSLARRVTPKPLAPEALRRVCDPTTFDFESTADLEPLLEPLGQQRARRALELALSVEGAEYNAYAMGLPRSGKRSAVQAILETRAASANPSQDVCYVNRFDRPREPRAILLPRGRGYALHDAVSRMIGELRTAIPAVFEGEELRKRREAIESEAKELNENAFATVRKAAEERGVGIIGTPAGFTLAPIRDGELVTQEAFDASTEQQKKAFTDAAEETERSMRTFIATVSRREREARRAIKAAASELVAAVVGEHVAEIREPFADLPEVVEHLDAMRADIVEHATDWLELPGNAPSLPAGLLEGGAVRDNPMQRRYGVHVLVDRRDEKGAPVVSEPNPSYENLVGTMDHVPVLGALLTDIHLIKAGALHRANGGYLLLDARAMFSQPFAWEALKRALKTHQIAIEPPGRMLGILGGVALAPEAIPLSVKVVLVGERELFYRASELDPDFAGLFRIAADFDDDVDRTPESERAYARFVAKLVRDSSLLPCDRTAVARVIEHASRLSEASDEMSVRVGEIASLLRESTHFARGEAAAQVAARHVDAAIEAAEERNSRIRERLFDAIDEGRLLVSTSGSRVGQINGLTVARIGAQSFGWPTRITARVRMGGSGVIDIEKEVELGGPIHSKGVLILGGFLAGRYTADLPLSLHATLVLEQSYGHVEGDSASLAELYALLSAIAEVPIRQDLALTGSVNQHGDVQAIGGVNEKIEGFFDVCRRRADSATHTLLIPASNVRNLCLRSDVIAAAREGRFEIRPLETVDDGIELLFGMPAGERGPDGLYPEGTLNRRVEDRLRAFHQKRLEFSKSN